MDEKNLLVLTMTSQSNRSLLKLWMKNVSWHYIVEALPNLIETFISHFVYCFIAYKRKDITIPIALHYAYNFLGMII